MHDPIEMVLPAGAEPVIEKNSRCVMALGASDRPTSLTIRLFVRLKKLTIEPQYLAGMEEPCSVFAANHVQVFVGEFSRRLLKFELKLSSLTDPNVTARDITRELSRAVAELQRRSESTDNIGTRLNRLAVARDLDLELGPQSVPPPWIVQALERAHESRSTRESV